MVLPQKIFFLGDFAQICHKNSRFLPISFMGQHSMLLKSCATACRDYAAARDNGETALKLHLPLGVAIPFFLS